MSDTTKRFKFLGKVLILTVSSFLFSRVSYAAGFATDSHSASALGTSYAGSVSGASDISDSFFNPAAISAIKQNQALASLTYINFKVDDDNTKSTYHSDSSNVFGVRSNRQTVNAFIPAGYIASRINDKTTLGLSITSPFGLSTSYNSNWAGRYYAIDSQISSVNFNPMISYELDKKLSLGFGVQAQYLQATLTNAVDIGGLYLSSPGGSDGFAKVKGDDWGYGFNGGLKYKFSDDLIFGIGYRSAIKHKLDGDIKLESSAIGNQTSNFNAKLTTPENITAGFSYKLNDKITLLHDTSFTRWSRVKTLNINAQNSNLTNSTNLNFKDSFRYSFGAHFQQSEKLKLKIGAAYEQGSVGNDSRNPRLPVSDKVWTSIGFGYKIGSNTTIDAAYLHEFYKKNKVDLQSAGSNTTNIIANYKNKIDVIVVSLKIDF